MLDNNLYSKNALLGPAQQLAAAGLSVIPVDAHKRPTETWKPFQTRAADTDAIAHWFTANGTPAAPALAVICGAISGSLTVLDFDTDAEGGTLQEPFEAMVEARAPGLLARLPHVRTPSGGLHIYLRAERCEGNTKLAMSAEGHVRIETRGEGGYVVAPPSPGYRTMQGTLRAITKVTEGEYRVLVQCARALSETPAEPPRPTNIATHQLHGDRPGDAYNARATLHEVADLLCRHGWTAGAAHGDKIPLTRAGKSPREGTSGDVTFVQGIPVFTQFSTNGGPFEPQRGYSAFATYAILEHGGDYAAAARALGPALAPIVSAREQNTVAEQHAPIPDADRPLVTALAYGWPDTRCAREDAALAMTHLALVAGWEHDRISGLLSAIAQSAADRAGELYAKAVPLVARRLRQGRLLPGWQTIARTCGALARLTLEEALLPEAPSDEVPYGEIPPLSVLMAKEFPESKPIVEKIIQRGCTLLGAPPKMGKTWFMLAVALAVAQGGRALGQLQVEGGRVAYIALEDGERQTQARFKKLLGGAPIPDLLNVVNRWHAFDEGGIADLDAWLARHPDTKLVVIDTLMRVRPRGMSERTMYERDYEALGPITDLAHKYDVAIVMVHHTRKMEAEDVFETVSGSYGLTGAVDAVLILKRERFGGEAVIAVSGRDIEEMAYALTWDRTLCTWRFEGNAEERQLTKGQAAVTAALERARRPLSLAEIADAIGRRNDESLRQFMKGMVDRGLAIRVERGRYTMTPPASALVIDVISPEPENDSGVAELQDTLDEEYQAEEITSLTSAKRMIRIRCACGHTAGRPAPYDAAIALCGHCGVEQPDRGDLSNGAF